MDDIPSSASVDRAIRSRRTIKAISAEPAESSAPRASIDAIVAAAGWAPFHKPASRHHREGSRPSLQPWRCYKLDAQACRALRIRLIKAGDATKIPQMLAVADALIQVTWLPNLPDPSLACATFDPTIENMEHIAAAGAAIENMLIAAAGRDIPSYWSSGGALRSPEVFAWLGMPPAEILLGSVFLFPPEGGQRELAYGSLRDKRGDFEDWTTWVDLDDAR